MLKQQIVEAHDNVPLIISLLYRNPKVISIHHYSIVYVVIQVNCLARLIGSLGLSVKASDRVTFRLIIGQCLAYLTKQ